MWLADHKAGVQQGSPGLHFPGADAAFMVDVLTTRTSRMLQCCLSITTSNMLSAYPSSNLGVLVYFIMFYGLDMAADSI